MFLGAPEPPLSASSVWWLLAGAVPVAVVEVSSSSDSDRLTAVVAEQVWPLLADVGNRW